MTGFFKKLNKEENFTEDNWVTTRKRRTNTHYILSIVWAVFLGAFVFLRLVSGSSSWWGWKGDTIMLELVAIGFATIPLFAGAILTTIPKEKKKIKNYEDLDLSGADVKEAKEDIKEDYEDLSFATQLILISSAIIFFLPYILYGISYLWALINSPPEKQIPPATPQQAPPAHSALFPAQSSPSGSR